MRSFSVCSQEITSSYLEVLIFTDTGRLFPTLPPSSGYILFLPQCVRAIKGGHECSHAQTEARVLKVVLFFFLESGIIFYIIQKYLLIPYLDYSQDAGKTKMLE